MLKLIRTPPAMCCVDSQIPILRCWQVLFSTIVTTEVKCKSRSPNTSHDSTLIRRISLFFLLRTISPRVIFVRKVYKPCHACNPPLLYSAQIAEYKIQGTAATLVQLNAFIPHHSHKRMENADLLSNKLQLPRAHLCANDIKIASLPKGSLRFQHI